MHWGVVGVNLLQVLQYRASGAGDPNGLAPIRVSAGEPPARSTYGYRDGGSTGGQPRPPGAQYLGLDFLPEGAHRSRPAKR
jgi:hypothetical protein